MTDREAITLTYEEARQVAGLILTMPETDYVEIRITKKDNIKVRGINEEDLS